MKAFLMLISFFLLSNQLWAAEVIGRITKLRGTVIRVNKDLSLNDNLKLGDKIFVGDKVESETASFAKVLMKDDTVFSIGPQTEFIFEQFKERKGNDRDATYNLVRGKLRSLFTKKAPKRTLRIKTPVASMAVRGTEIVSDVYRYKGEVRADIGLLSGILEVRSKGKIIQMKPQDMFEGRRGFDGNSKSGFAKKKMDSKVFQILKKAEKNGGVPFLNDAFKKGGKTRKADFSKVSFNRMMNSKKPKFASQRAGAGGAQAFQGEKAKNSGVTAFKPNVKDNKIDNEGKKVDRAGNSNSNNIGAGMGAVSVESGSSVAAKGAPEEKLEEGSEKFDEKTKKRSKSKRRKNPKLGKNVYSVAQDVQERKGPLEDLKQENEELERNPAKMDKDAKRRMLRRALIQRRTALPTLKPCPIGTTLIGGVCSRPRVLDDGSGTRTLSETNFNVGATTTDTGGSVIVNTTNDTTKESSTTIYSKTQDANITTTLQDASTGTFYEVQKTSTSTTTLEAPTSLYDTNTTTTIRTLDSTTTLDTTKTLDTTTTTLEPVKSTTTTLSPTTTTIKSTTTTSPTTTTIQKIDLSGSTTLSR